MRKAPQCFCKRKQLPLPRERSCHTVHTTRCCGTSSGFKRALHNAVRKLSVIEFFLSAMDSGEMRSTDRWRGSFSSCITNLLLADDLYGDLFSSHPVAPMPAMAPSVVKPGHAFSAVASVAVKASHAVGTGHASVAVKASHAASVTPHASSSAAAGPTPALPSMAQAFHDHDLSEVRPACWGEERELPVYWYQGRLILFEP